MGSTSRGRVLLEQAAASYARGDNSAAAALYADCLSLFKEGTPEYGVVLVGYASALAESGQTDPAIVLFSQALRIFRAHKQQTSSSSTHFNLGNAYFYSNRFPEAMNQWECALAGFTEIGDSEQVAMCLTSIANLLASFPTSQSEMKRQYVGKLDSLAASMEGKPNLLRPYLQVKAKIRMSDGDLSEAAALGDLALQQALNGGDLSYVADAQAFLAGIYRRLGQYEKARPLLEAAYLYSKNTRSRLHIENCFELALVSAEQKNRLMSAGLFEECLDTIDYERAGLDGLDKYGYMQYQGAGPKYIEMLITWGRAGKAFEIAERVQGRILLDQMFRHQFKRQAGRTLRASKNSGRLMLDAPSLAEMQEAVRESGLHVVRLFYISESVLHGWYLTPEGALLDWDASSSVPHIINLLEFLPKSPLDASLDSRAGAFSGGPGSTSHTTRPATPKDWRAFSELAEQVYLQLFPPSVRSSFETREGKLAIVAHRELFALPFAALGESQEKRLGRRWQIALISSIGAFLQADRRRDAWIRDPETTRKALVVGYGGAQTVFVRLRRNTPETIAMSFDALGGAEAEARSVARQYGQEPLLGSNATWSNIAPQFFKANVVHIATHGFWHPHIGEWSFLLLAPTHSDPVHCTVQADYLMDVMTTAELIILSGCQTGLGRAHPDSYIGLAQSLLIAGARSVLVSLWPISDDMTAAFMRRFHEQLLAGVTPAEALQAIQQWFQDLNTHQELRDWAGFQLLGQPFYSVLDTASEAYFQGPIFCGGDMLWSDGQRRQVFPLEEYKDLRQGINDSFWIKSGELIILQKSWGG